MTTSHAFLLINVHNPVYFNKSRPVAELRQIAGVKRVEEVSGLYDFLVEIETPDKLEPILENLMSQPWLKLMHVLQPAESENHEVLHGVTEGRQAVKRKEDTNSPGMKTSAQSWLNSAL